MKETRDICANWSSHPSLSGYDLHVEVSSSFLLKRRKAFHQCDAQTLYLLEDSLLGSLRSVFSVVFPSLDCIILSLERSSPV